MDCPFCKSRDAWKNGFNCQIKKRMYKCRSCKRQFHENTRSSLKRMRHPAEVIALVLELHSRNNYSNRRIHDLLMKKGMPVSCASIGKWIKKFDLRRDLFTYAEYNEKLNAEILNPKNEGAAETAAMIPR